MCFYSPRFGGIGRIIWGPRMGRRVILLKRKPIEQDKNLNPKIYQDEKNNNTVFIINTNVTFFPEGANLGFSGEARGCRVGKIEN